MIVHFVGAGPGDPELLTKKAERLLRTCRICVYAGSLVSPGVLALIPEEAERHDSARMSHDEVVAVYSDAQERGIDVVRLHSGDPSIYGATREQMNALDALEIPYDVCPGVSAFQAAAASLCTELTAPEISQTIILTRTAGRTPASRGAGTRPDRPNARHPLPLPVGREDPGGGRDTRRPLRGGLSRRRRPSRLLAGGADHPGDAGRHCREDRSRGDRLDGAHRRGAGPLARRPRFEALRSCLFPRLQEGKETMNAVTTALITLSEEGAKLLAPLVAALPGTRLFIHESVRAASDGETPGTPEAERFTRIADLTASLFPVCRGLVYAAPCGVVVRAIAPLIQSKYEDPAVVVLDAGGRWAVSLLSGHEGGANALAIRVANLLGAEPVITTTTEALKSVIVGIGCRRGTPAERIVAAVQNALADAGIPLDEVRLLASADVKADEAGLLAAAEALGVPDPLHCRRRDPRVVQGIFPFGICRRKSESACRRRTGGAFGGKEDPIHLQEEKGQRHHDRPGPGRLFVVGIGPGGPLDRTRRAEEAIAASDCVVGYTRYMELVSDITAGKELIATGMTRETERCRIALARATEGKTVSLISSGDPGIYGMAGLVLELAAAEGNSVPIEIVPGVTAAQALAARLGAPLMCDYATLSLSDLLVPWETIRERLEAVAAADLVVALYNPRSQKRTRQLDEAAAIFRRHRPGTTPVGIGTAMGSPDEQILLSDLDRFLELPIAMRSVVIIGGRSTKRIAEWFVTPRGYEV